MTAQEAIDEYQSSTSGRSASMESAGSGPETLGGLFMGQSVPINKEVETMSIENLAAETPLLQPKKNRLAKSANKSEVYKLEKKNKAAAQAIAKSPQQRTVLLTKEIHDDLEYMANLDLQLIFKLSLTEAQLAYKTLVRSVRPVFSGALDHRINMLDARKVLPVLALDNLNKSQLTEQDLNLMLELKTMSDKLVARKLLHGYWDCITEAKGCLPDSRESSTMAMVDETIYVFGGFSREIYNDTRAYDMQHKTWRPIVYEPGERVPDKRQNHTMLTYGKNLYLFGGSGPYMPSVKMRASYNDTWAFETDKQKWVQQEPKGLIPKKRINHVACMFGCIMVVHGGFSTEGKVMLADFNLLDIEMNRWLEVQVCMNGQKVKSEAEYLNKAVVGSET